MKKSSVSDTAGKDNAGGFFVKILLVITIIGWLLRLIAAWEMSQTGGEINNMFSPPVTSDLATYMTLGKACAAGEFPETFYYQPYYYAVFLGLIYLIFGNLSLYAVIFIQSLLSAFTVFLTGICGRKLFSGRAGLIAAGLVAVSSSLILYVPYHQNETLQTFHLILLFYLTLTACEKKSWYWWGLNGLIAGIAVLTRGNIWILLPGIAVAGLASGKMQKKAWVNCAVFIFCLLVVQLPFIIHNSAALKRLSGPSTAADAVLALGNGVDAPAGGRDVHEGAGAMYYSESYRRMMANTAGEYDTSVPVQIWKWFCDDPAGFIELQFRKALLFWDGREIPNNVSLENDGCQHSLILRNLFIGRNHFILALGLCGILWFFPVLCGKRVMPGVPLLYIFTGLFYASVVMFYILSRFKAPILPLLAVLGGGVICDWLAVWRKREWKSRSIVIMILLFSVWVTSRSYDFYRSMEPGIQRCIHADGIALDLGRPDVLHFDHGPQPFGGWNDMELVQGMIIEKRFAKLGTVPAEVQIMMTNVKEADVVMSINDHVLSFRLPSPELGRSIRKIARFPRQMIVDGKICIKVYSVSGGQVFLSFDTQRNYGRSFCNQKTLPGEWVIRANVSK